mmetsp:Transcript_411/g.805  ORF Transcript_411/g.805 Transcript_411/m.805 type:complete len:200 (-) Transcript_411:295-894(-)
MIYLFFPFKTGSRPQNAPSNINQKKKKRKNTTKYSNEEKKTACLQRKKPDYLEREFSVLVALAPPGGAQQIAQLPPRPPSHVPCVLRVKSRLVSVLESPEHVVVGGEAVARLEGVHGSAAGLLGRLHGRHHVRDLGALHENGPTRFRILHRVNLGLWQVIFLEEVQALFRVSHASNFQLPTHHVLELAQHENQHERDRI